MKKGVLTLLVAAFGCLPTAFAEEARTLNDAVYTKAQAKVGEALYKTNCLTCHDKKYFRPVLKRWAGQPLSTFYTVMAASMPESNPGSLPDDEYIDILAYIISLSRYPAGDSELEHGAETLANITIADRK